MNYLAKLANLQDYAFSNSYEIIEMFIYSMIAFFVPFFIGQPQLIVGTVVNAMLIISALNLKGAKLLPVIILPSLATLSRGLVFGPFTIYLLYLIPFIWIGNSLLVYCFKLIKLKMKKNYFVTLLVSSSVKSIFLFSITYALFLFNLVPVIFLTAMGLMQITTALLGGLVAYPMHKLKKRFY
jgi:hypothetical protein